MKIVEYQHSLSVMAEPMAPYPSEFDKVVPLVKASANTDICFRILYETGMTDPQHEGDYGQGISRHETDQGLPLGPEPEAWFIWGKNMPPAYPSRS